LQIKSPNKEQAQRFRQREREREKDHAVKSKKRGGKFIYGFLKGKEKLCEEDM
jgi:hypothetical protein